MFPSPLSNFLVTANPDIPFMLCASLMPIHAPAVCWGTSLKFADLIALFIKNMISRSENKDTIAYNLSDFNAIDKATLNSVLIKYEEQKNKKSFNRKFERQSEREKFIENAFGKLGNRFKKLSLRRKGYVSAFGGIIIDFDNDQPPYIDPKNVLALLPKNMSFVLHNSFSDSETRPKYRLVIPFAAPISKSRCYYEKLYHPFINLIDPDLSHCGAKRIDKTCAQEFRGFYVPNYPTSKPGGYCTEPINGTPWIVARHGKFIDGQALYMETLRFELRHMKIFGKKNA